MQNNNLMYDPDFIASLLQAEGRSQGQAISDAAIIAHNKQQVLMQQQKHAQEQFMRQQLPQILRELSGKPPQEAAAMLTQLGIPLQDAALILERLGLTTDNTGKAAASKTFTGADNIQYEAFKDQNGRLTSQPIPGQLPPKKELTNYERDNLATSNSASNAAMNSIKLVAEAKRASQQFADKTGRNTGPNTFASKVTDPGEDYGIAGTIGNYAAYTKEARAARQVMAKVNKSLIIDIIKSLEGTGIRPSVFMETIMNGTTPMDSIDDAAKEILYNDILRVSSTVVAANKFKQQYAKAYGTLDGADLAFSKFRAAYGIKDEDNGEYYLIDPKTDKYDVSIEKKISEYIAGTADGEDFFPESQPSYIEPPKSEWEMARDILREDGTIQ